MIQFSSIRDMLDLAEKQQLPLWEIVLRQETERSQKTREAVWQVMADSLQVMRQAAQTGVHNQQKSLSGLVGGDANRLFRRQGCCQLSGEVTIKAAAYALAVSEVNAGMGKIVACPTAGSCGIVPGALLSVADTLALDDAVVIKGLFTAAGIGLVIAENASIAGAIGGCQAECGSAAAMAAAAVTEMAGGTPAQSAAALTLALKNLLGLACDPVAGLVEVPCVKRNAFGAAHALLAAEMALAGIESVIPPDEVIATMHQIGLAMPRALKETSEGGLAKTPTAVKITERIMGGAK